MKKICLICFCLLSISGLYAQKTDTFRVSDDDKVWTFVQQQPIFAGNINQWISDNLVYPEDAQKNGVQGTVYISFIVEKDGSVSHVLVMRSSGSTSLDNAGVNIFSKMPKWTPGMIKGHTVRVTYMLPIRFILKDAISTPSQK